MGKYPVEFNIAHICIDGHKYIFDDIIRSLQGSLIDLGYECDVRENEFAKDAINIAVGSVIFLSPETPLMAGFGKQPFVLYQMEQLDPDYGLAKDTPAYQKLLESAAQIWEYSRVGWNYLRGTPLGAKTSFVPPAFHRNLEKFRPAEDPDIDVLFYGSMSDRRAQVLEALRADGVRAVNVFGVYGDALGDYIRRSKIVLNMHMWQGLSVLETVRLSFLLANRCFVISETADHNPYGGGVVYAEYDQLVETCKSYLAERAAQRAAIAAAGYIAIRQSDMVENLRPVIDELPFERLAAGFIYP